VDVESCDRDVETLGVAVDFFKSVDCCGVFTLFDVTKGFSDFVSCDNEIGIRKVYRANNTIIN